MADVCCCWLAGLLADWLINIHGLFHIYTVAYGWAAQSGRRMWLELFKCWSLRHQCLYSSLLSFLLPNTFNRVLILLSISLFLCLFVSLFMAFYVSLSVCHLRWCVFNWKYKVCLLINLLRISRFCFFSHFGIGKQEKSH